MPGVENNFMSGYFIIFFAVLAAIEFKLCSGAEKVLAYFIARFR